MTVRKQTQATDATGRPLERLTVLAQAMGTARDLTTVFRALRDFAVAVTPTTGIFVSLYDPDRQERTCVYSAGPDEEDDVSALPPRPINDNPQSRAIMTGQVVVTHDFQGAIAGKSPVTLGAERDPRLPQSAVDVPMAVQGKVIGAFEVQSVEPAAYAGEHVAAMRMAGSLAAIAIENVRLLNQERDLLAAAQRELAERRRAVELLRQHAQELTALNRTGQELSRLAEPAEILQLIYKMVGEVLDNSNFLIALYDETEETITFPVYTIDGELRPRAGRPLGNGATEYVIRTKRPLHIPRNVTAALDERGIDHIGREARSFLAVPMLIGERTIGVVCLQDYVREDVYEDRHVELLSTFASQAAVALENARLYAMAQQELAERRRAEEVVQRQVQQLQALRSIDMAITASMDLRVALNIILDQVTAQLKVDAANVLLHNPHTQTLQYAVNRGFRTTALQHANLRLGTGHAGRAALQRQVIYVPDLREVPDEFVRSRLLPEEGFVAYYAVPLIAKGLVKGVLEIFHRAPLEGEEDWLSLLETLASQAAIAIDNSSLFHELQRTNLDLVLAYDTTLEGWSRAMDLRDKETEGHTQRVTDLTLRLAQAMGVPDAELPHIRRGALLHDIGKMGIPDPILLKPGPLTDEEWVIMRRHPAFAHDLLSPIAYLRPALDIPYCHHEKWDGTGYPRGLKGEQIPLAARIFAVVDVWDALCSDRPYRPAWSAEQARAYVQEQAGKHFDPRVVEAFLRIDA